MKASVQANASYLNQSAIGSRRLKTGSPACVCRLQNSNLNIVIRTNTASRRWSCVSQSDGGSPTATPYPADPCRTHCLACCNNWNSVPKRRATDSRAGELLKQLTRGKASSCDACYSQQRG